MDCAEQQHRVVRLGAPLILIQPLTGRTEVVTRTETSPPLGAPGRWRRIPLAER